MTQPRHSIALAGMHAWLGGHAEQQISVTDHAASNDSLSCVIQSADLYDIRSQRFVAQGMPQHQADALAARLLVRDEQWDDRHSCAECANLAHGSCMARREPLGGGGFMALHRCIGFQEVER